MVCKLKEINGVYLTVHFIAFIGHLAPIQFVLVVLLHISFFSLFFYITIFPLNTSAVLNAMRWGKSNEACYLFWYLVSFIVNYFHSYPFKFLNEIQPHTIGMAVIISKWNNMEWTSNMSLVFLLKYYNITWISNHILIAVNLSKDSWADKGTLVRWNISSNFCEQWLLN